MQGKAERNGGVCAGGPGTPFGGLVNQFEPFTYALFPGENPG
eukprot:COSAG06_NODE_1402_length_9571_cov_8.528294_4_plen_42_part_00